MKFKQWLFALVAAVTFAGSAQADVVKDLQLRFQSGAAFTGQVTFNDDYTRLLDADGWLTGGSYGSVAINWAWWLGTGQNVGDWDGNAATNEDWLMDGTPSSWQYFIGISWFVPVVDGNVTLNLAPNTSVYHAGVNSTDAIVDYSFNAVSEPQSLALLGLGLAFMGFAARRRAAR